MNKAEKKEKEKIKKPTKAYYSINNILSINAQYNILLGERSNGKSYAVKKHCVEEAYNNDKTFILLRRYGVEVKPSVVGTYFDDCPIQEISKGKCTQINIMRGEIWACNYDDAKNKVIKEKFLGWVRDLSSESHNKSAVFKNCYNIIFEEFVSSDLYLNNEPLLLQSFISTVFRRREGRVWLIGNTISRVNPYYTAWQLTNLKNQKQGTIETYRMITDEIDEETGEKINVLIAVEFCEHSNHTASKMFFGQASKMTTSGAWETQTYPHLPIDKDLDDYYVNHRIIFHYSEGNFKFEMLFLTEKDGDGFCWYIRPKTTSIKEGTRVITDLFSSNPLYTNSFRGLNSKEDRLLKVLKEGKICFSDNLTGSDFYSCFKNF